MFPFLKKKDNAALAAQCAKLVDTVRPEVERLMSYAAGPANKGLTEYYATVYYLWLAREKADWNALLPCLPEAALDSLTMMRLRPEDRKKRLHDIRGYWKTLAREEAALLRMGLSPLGWLENSRSGLAGIAAGDREFAENLLPVTAALIHQMKLTAYESFVPPQEDKPPLSDLRPQPPRPEQFVTVTDHQGNAVKLQLLDVITTADGTFSCLRRENQNAFVVFKNLPQPGGRTAYGSAGVSETKLVLAVFRTRNPQYFEED